MRVIIIHHDDADGRCAAAVIAQSDYCRDDKGVLIKPEFIEVDYGMLKPDWPDSFTNLIEAEYDTVDHVNKIFVVDFSLPEDMVARLECVTDLYWIDHHASAAKYNYHHLKGLRNFEDKAMSGCELAWEFSGLSKQCAPGEFGSIPTIVKLIGDYDKWALHYEDRCKPLILALDAMQLMPDDARWPMLLGLESPYELEFAVPQQMIRDGEAMTRYRDGYAGGMCKAFGFETEFEGLNCYAVNLVRMGSQAFGDKMKEYDACIAFAYDGRRFTVSMYSEKPAVDCSVICKRHGGGGHKGASGFICEALPFKRVTDI